MYYNVQVICQVVFKVSKTANSRLDCWDKCLCLKKEAIADIIRKINPWFHDSCAGSLTQILLSCIFTSCKYFPVIATSDDKKADIAAEVSNWKSEMWSMKDNSKHHGETLQE